jgi:hypothetical protein
MEGSDERGGAKAPGGLTAAIERDGVALFRLACALSGEDDAESILELALQDACDAADEGAFDGPRLFAAVRRRASQSLEQRRKSGGSSRPAFSELRIADVRPTEREALLLRYIAGLSLADVAAAAAVDQSAARTRLCRALSFMARLHADPADEPPADVAAGRRMVEAALADLLDGAADAAVENFVAEDDWSRDLVHEAEQVVAKLRAYEPARRVDFAALEQRVVSSRGRAARDDERPAPSDAAENAADAAATKDTTSDTTDAAGGAATKATTSDATDAAGGAATTMPRDDGAPRPAAAIDEERRSRRKRLGIVLAACAALGAFAFAVTRSGSSEDGSASWSGKLATVSRAFGGGAGVERCSPDRAVCSRVEEGDDVPAGSTLRTDGQTRAVLSMRDGTRLVLDRDTELLLDAGRARRARLDHGSVVADVPPLGDTRARIDLPLGFMETESVKVSLVADASRVDADVARGAVRLVDEDERGVAVHAGEVGRLEPASAPFVFPSASFGDRFGWTERAFRDRTTSDEVIRGLGELGAKRPGDEQEEKGLVTLASHLARVRIAGNVARTEIEEVFTSSSDDVLEGVFRFPLPPDAQIERLALDVDGKIEEGAFVDRDRAQAIWRGAIVNAGAKRPVGEEIVWVPGPWRDPALLEWQRGGRFELRIYPIPRRASRKVLLSYTQVVPESGGIRRYAYPLPYDPSGSTRVGRFELDVEVRGRDPNRGVVARGYEMRQEELSDGARALRFVAQGFSPSGDLTVEYSLPHAGSEVTAWAYRPAPDEIAKSPGGADDAAYVAIALRPKLPRSQDAVERDFAIVVDSSRSMFGERFQRAMALTGSIVREMDRGDRVTVLACDSTCREMPRGLSNAGPEMARAVTDFLAGITPEGGSDVAFAVRRGRDALRGAPMGAQRVVYVGDGTPTIGPVSPAFIRREIEAAVPRDAGTVTAVAIGADADVTTLAMLAEAGGGVMVPYVPGQTVLDAAYALLGATYGTTLSDVRVELPQGLTDLAPQRIGSIRAGGETMLVARLSAPQISGTLTIHGTLSGAQFEQRYPLTIDSTTSKANAFVPRLWAAGKIAELEQQPDAASRSQAIELSSRFHVASRYTSLLVLESAAMMHAFGLERDERAPLWAGDGVAESTSANGETAVDDADDGRGMLSDKSAMKDLATGSAGEGAPAAPQRRASRERLADEEYARPAPAAPHAASKPKAESSAPYALDAPSKKQSYAPPPPAATGPAGVLGNAGGGLAYEPRDDMSGPLLMPSPYSPPRPNFGRRYIPMRKIWERVGRIVVPPGLPDHVTSDAVNLAELAAVGSDPSRESLKRLYTLYMLSGRLDGAASVAERWSTKDPLDPEALTARADVAAARGDRDVAIRILGSVLDVRPGDSKAVFRLARLYRWAGNAELACRHSMAAAQIRGTDEKLLVDAVRCTRDLGAESVASDLMALADEKTRRAADALLTAKPADPSVLSGDLRIEATWDGGDDLDLAFLTPDGGRVSWLGAPTRAVITARDVRSTTHEGLALRGGAPGDYLVEVTRPAGHRGAVRGSMTIYVAGARSVAPFELTDTSRRVALLKITTRPRLVPL